MSRTREQKQKGTPLPYTDAKGVSQKTYHERPQLVTHGKVGNVLQYKRKGGFKLLGYDKHHDGALAPIRLSAHNAYQPCNHMDGTN